MGAFIKYGILPTNLNDVFADYSKKYKSVKVGALLSRKSNLMFLSNFLC